MGEGNSVVAGRGAARRAEAPLTVLRIWPARQAKTGLDQGRPKVEPGLGGARGLQRQSSQRWGEARVRGGAQGCAAT